VPDARATARPLVLLIEDNLTQLDLYSMLIEDELSVITASRGLTGLELAMSQRPAAIILDLGLPDLDGFSLADRLRANPATAAIPIVVLTGDDAAHARASRDRRFRDVLLKPCAADKLLAVLRQALAS